MFRKEINVRRIIAVSLVFCLIFSNCLTLFSNISFAEANELGKQQSENTSSNVVYDAKLIKDDDESYEKEESIDEENLAIKINVEVKNEGYLKSARILIESENGLSFEMLPEDGENYNFDGNIINLNNISVGEKTDILIPIKYKEREDIGNLNKKINVKLIGIYVNKLGEEKSISENVVLRLIWNTNTEFNITSSLKKYIPYSSENKSGAIIQTTVKAAIPTNNTFVNKEEIEIEAIKLEEYELDKVYVTSKSEILTDFWKYDEENNKIQIKLEEKETAIKSEEFLITYIFLGEKDIELPFKINSKINGTIFMFGTEETAKTEIEAEYAINEKLGDIITVEAKAITEEIKIGKLIANKVNEEKPYSLNYEVELTSDISSNNLVEGILIKDAGEEFEIESERFATTMSYYKSLKISKENFEDLLGVDGNIQILNSNQEEIITIDKNTTIDEENNYTIILENNENKINIKTSKPINVGILTIKAEKEMIDSEYSKEQLKTFSKLDLKYVGSIIYSDNIENIVSNTETKIVLEKPITKAEMKISRNTLSTIADNKDVQITIELNNISDEIDLYENPNFEITFPEYIKNVEITNLAIANSEDVFNIKESNLYINQFGRITLGISLEGVQKTYNSNNIVNGTNIIINANINLDMYTPSKTEKITMTYTNQNATSYSNEVNGIGYSEVEVEYKAPTGVVSINKIYDYNDVGSSIVSVAQGKVTDKIEIFAEAKVATMDIIVMNNKENACDNVRILGRIPFKGNKDVRTGEDLGTTVDTSLASHIFEASENKVKAHIYYSENGEATDDLSDSKNGWMENVIDLSNIKSYLIVLEDYEMNPGEIIKYTYKYRIPENLEHNNNIYGSFETKFDNINEIYSEEVSSPDIVGLTTGIGPQMNIEVTTNVQDKVKEYEKVKYTISIQNTGSEIAENIAINAKIPTDATLAVHNTYATLQEAKGWSLRSDREVIKKIEKINPGEVKKVEFFVQANKLQKNIEEDNQEIKLVCEATITAKDLAKEIHVQDNGIIVEKSNLVAEETISSEEAIAKVNETIEANIQIKNNSNETMKNIVVTKVLPEGLKYSESYVRGYEEDGITIKKINTSTYDAQTRTITWIIDELQPDRTAIVIGKLIVGEMEDKVYKNTISTISNIKVNGEEYQAGQVDVTIGRPSLVIEQTSNKTNEYIKAGDDIEYTFNIKNIGSVRANNVVFTDELPDEVKINKLVYTADGVEVTKVVAQNEDATVYTSILPENEMEVKITARVGEIQEKQKTIENKAAVSAKTVDTVEANKVLNVIESVGELIPISTESSNNKAPTSNNTTLDDNSDNNKANNQTNQNIKTKYEIKGTVWLDKNKNGSQDSGEDKISGIEVKLVHATTGEQIEKTVTTADGEYKFSNLDNGSYIAVFYYDNERYALTDYKKQGIDEIKNSDVISGSENGRNIATTDTIKINNGSISNINMGLITATIFDLSLEKSVTKVTLQTDKGTTTYDYDHEKIAKIDINGKYLEGAKIIAEYTFTVKNEGDIEGYAKKLVDYLPSELEFSTELNKNWYIGSDGNLYNEELANMPIAGGASKQVKLVLTKNLDENGTGIINNQAEIAESYNKSGIEDKDSKANNKKQSEDDMSSADLIIGIKTGDTLIYFSIIILIVIAGLITAIIIKKNKLILKLELKLRKEV